MGKQIKYYSFHQISRFNKFENYFIVLLLLLTPVKSFIFRYLIELIALFYVVVKYRNNINAKNISTIIIVIIPIILIDTYQLLKNNSIIEYYDIIRVTTLITLLAHIKYYERIMVDNSLYVLSIINFIVCIYVSIYGDISFLNEHVNSLSSIETFGRLSGIFTNIAVNGIISGFITIYIIIHSKKYIMIIFPITTLYLSGSKTAMLATFIIILLYYININLRSLKSKKISKISITLLIMIIAIIIYVPILAENNHVVRDILTFINNPNVTSISSFGKRVYIWSMLYEGFSENIGTILSGMSRNTISLITKTYDSDIIWFMANYGLFGVITYIILIISLLNKTINKKDKYLILYLIICSLTLGVFTTPNVLALITIYVATYILKKNSSVNSSKKLLLE